jgi:hypothetical protein
MNDDRISLLRHGRRQLEVYEVTSDQLDRMERAGTELGYNFHIGLLCIAIFIANIVNLVLSPPPPPGMKQTVFVVITVVSFALGAIYSIKWLRERGVHSDVFREVRNQPEIGPLGDETHEVRSTELAHLPLEPAPTPPAPPAPAQAEAAPAVAAATAAPESEKSK